MLNHRLQIAEYVFMAGSVIGWIVAIASGQLIYAAVPTSLALLLNLINRLRLEQRLRRRISSVIAQVYRQQEENQILQEQQIKKEIASLPTQFPGLFSQLEAYNAQPDDLQVRSEE